MDFPPLSFQRHAEGRARGRARARHKRERKQMRANEEKCRQTLATASRGEYANQREQNHELTRKQTLTPLFITISPLCHYFLHPPPPLQCLYLSMKSPDDYGVKLELRCIPIELRHANPPTSYRSLSGPRGTNLKKNSEKSLPGPPAPGVPKSLAREWNKSCKSPKGLEKSLENVRSRLFRTPGPEARKSEEFQEPQPLLVSEKELQYTSNLCGGTPPICIAVPYWLLSLEESETKQYTSHLNLYCNASHLYGSTPPICTAVLLSKYWGLG